MESSFWAGQIGAVVAWIGPFWLSVIIVAVWALILGSLAPRKNIIWAGTCVITILILVAMTFVVLQVLGVPTIDNPGYYAEFAVVYVLVVLARRRW